MTLPALALQFSTPGIARDTPTSKRDNTASQMYAACYDLLLRISSGEAAFIDFAYPILSEIRQVLSLILRQTSLFVNNDGIQQLLDQLMVSVLNLLMKTVNCPQNNFTSSHTDRNFRTALSLVQGLKGQLITELWICQLSPDAASVNNLREQMSRIQQQLWPNDQTSLAMYVNLSTARSFHTEYTCEWFAKPLLDFIRSSDKAFWIEGSAGCGKSMLFGWIIESLENQIGGQDYAVLSYVIDPLLPSGSGIMCLLKGLLRQAYQQNPGQKSLQLALLKLGDITVTSDYPQKLTDALWEAFAVVCDDTQQPSMLVIDGLSEMDGGDAAVQDFLDRVLHRISKSPMVRMVLLSRPLTQTREGSIRRFAIKASHNHQDIRRILERAVPIDSRSQNQEIINWILSKTNGDCLWGLLTIQHWRARQAEGLSTQVESLPRSLDATILMILSGIDFTNSFNRLLLLVSTVVTRPLCVAEVQCLLSIDMNDRALVRQDSDIKDLLDQGCGLLMVMQNDLIQFRHSMIQQAVCEYAQRNLRSSPVDIHNDLACRLLLYLRLMETPRTDLTLTPIASGVMDEVLRSYQLAPYALQYWTYHALQGDSQGGIHSICSVGNIKQIFPDTIFLAALEASFWSRQPPYFALQTLQITSRARQRIQEDHLAALQSAACLAVQLRNTQQFQDAMWSFAAAFQLSQQILPEFHPFVTECASECLQCMQSMPQNSSKDFHAMKSDVLLYMKARHAKHSGSSSDQTLEYSHLLARHYAETGQGDLCGQTYRDIYRLTVDRHGKSSPQTKAVAGQLVNVLEKTDQKEEQDQFDDIVYENAMTAFAATDGRRIKASILKAAAFKTRGDLANADLVYLELLQEVTECCQEWGRNEDQLQLLRIGLLYCEFLAEQYRDVEAQMVIVGLWVHFENHHSRDSSEIELLKDLAVEAQRRGLPAVALTILNSVSDWSKDHSIDSEDTRDVEATITHYSRELVSNDRSGSILPRSTQEVLMRTLQSTMLGGAPAMTVSVMQMLQTLIDSFCFEQRWTELVNIASSALSLLWPAVLKTSYERNASGDHGLLERNIARSLAKAYMELDEEAFAGYIYLHILRAVSHATEQGTGFDSKSFVDMAQTTFQIFERLERNNEMISVAQELLDHYRQTLGDLDPRTIEATYDLASLCMQHGDNNAAKSFYTAISERLQDSNHHDQRAIPALKAMLSISLRERNWVQSRKVYNSLWQTFLHKGKEYRASEQTIRSLFKGYAQLLETHFGVNHEDIHQLRQEYRDGCANAYGSQALITLQASMTLAKSWQSQDRNSPHAIHIYESMIDDHANDRSSIHQDVSDLLERAEVATLEHYRTHCEKAMDHLTIERAINLQRNQFSNDKTRFGCYSPSTLSSLATYVQFLTKENSPDCRDTAVQELKRAIESVLQSDCEGKASFDAGVIIASSFVNCGYVTEGIRTAHRIRESIILEDGYAGSQYLPEGVQTNDRSRLTFSAAFETQIRGSLENFTKIYSMTLLETTLWESFQVLFQTSSPLELVLARGTRLQAVMRSHHSSYDGEGIEQQMFNRFIQIYGAAFTTGTQTARAFFSMLLRRMGEVRGDIVLPELACIALNDETRRLLTLGDYGNVMEIATAGFDFIHYIGAYGHATYVQYGFQFGMLLGDQPIPLSSNIASSRQMVELSKTVLREVAQLCRTKNFGFGTMDLNELSKVAAVLGKQQNYHDLEVSFSIS